MTIEILVVDDSPILAQETAALVAAGVQLEAGYASDSTSALRLLEQYPITVAVLDQRMEPDISGTELFQRMRLIRPNLRAIMLTGEAERDEVGRALELGFSDYLPKGRIRELPNRVLIQYVKEAVVSIDENAEDQEVLLWSRRRWPWSRRGAEVRLVSKRIVAGRFVDNDEWVTVLQLNAGEERKITHQVARSTSVTVEEQSQRSLQANVGLKTEAVAEITSALQSTLSRSLKVSNSSQTTHTDSSEQTFRLPAELAPGSIYVRARLFQRAPIYRKIVVTLAVSCTCCDMSFRTPIVVIQSTGALATRHADHMSDQTVSVVDTGDVLF